MDNKDTKMNSLGGADVETFTFSCARLVARVKGDHTTNCKVRDVHPTSDLVSLDLPLMLELVAKQLDVNYIFLARVSLTHKLVNSKFTYKGLLARLF